MTLLLDTHTALWFWWDDDPQLSAAAKALILNPANHKLLSPATPWEVAIKAGWGWLPFWWQLRYLLWRQSRLLLWQLRLLLCR